jgi:hypothetical protein
MKRICLSVVGIFLTLFSAFAQPATKDSSEYRNRKLTFEEANLVSSYYRQDGNHSAVTGGIGTEKLTDIANVIDVKMNKWDARNRKHEFDLEIGIDHYSSASSDKIDPRNISSPSHADTRFYPAISWSMENQAKGSTIGPVFHSPMNLIMFLTGGTCYSLKKQKTGMANSLPKRKFSSIK